MTYEYECPGCGDVRQIKRKMTDAEETYICTACNNEFRRVWTAPTISFKGTGWGKDD